MSAAESFELADGVMERLASTDRPQPNIALVAIPDRGVDLAAVSHLVILDRLNDPGNLGTILRSAEASGADAIVLTPGSVDPYNPKVVRASAGALFHVPVIEATLADVAGHGIRLVGTSSHRGTSHTAFDWSGRIGIVLGSEAHGLDEDAPVDDWVRIDHRGRAESLNVAMAATLLVFQAFSGT